MKLFIQIPCNNEEKTLLETLTALPKNIVGFDEVEVLIIDDGSEDNSIEIAKDFGVKHFVQFHSNQGLAKGFMAGLKYCIKNGADVIVNTDADNQYDANDIPKLLQPILNKTAEVVIGERPIMDIDHFSLSKKILQKVGSWVVRIVSNTSILDAPSGFRAMSKSAAKQMNVFNDYTYTLETIIQAGQKRLPLISVPIRTNPDLRPSRLHTGIFSYIKRSIITILRIFVVYKHFVFFMSISLVLLVFGLILGIRFMYFYFSGDGDGHIQSVILSAILISISFQTGLIAFIADLQAVNRQLLEEIKINTF